MSATDKMMTFRQGQNHGNTHHCVKCSAFCDCKVRYVSSCTVALDSMDSAVVPERLEWICENCGYATPSETADRKETE